MSSHRIVSEFEAEYCRNQFVDNTLTPVGVYSGTWEQLASTPASGADNIWKKAQLLD
jgi:hypothetical protein